MFVREYMELWEVHPVFVCDLYAWGWCGGIVSMLWHMMLGSSSSYTVDCGSCDVEDLCCACQSALCNPPLSEPISRPRIVLTLSPAP
jgi:hypothetical protein